MIPRIAPRFALPQSCKHSNSALPGFFLMFVRVPKSSISMPAWNCLKSLHHMIPRIAPRFALPQSCKHSNSALPGSFLMFVRVPKSCNSMPAWNCLTLEPWYHQKTGTSARLRLCTSLISESQEPCTVKYQLEFLHPLHPLLLLQLKLFQAEIRWKFYLLSYSLL